MTTVNAYGWTKIGMVWSPPEHELYPDDEPDLPDDHQDWSDVEPRQQPAAMTADGRLRKTCPICGQRMEQRSKVCADCHAGRSMLAAGTEAPPIIVKKLRKRKRKPRPRPTKPAFVDFPPFHRYRATCEDCGCLLAHVEELCPSCVIPWLREAAREAVYASYQHQPTTTATPERIAA